MLRCKKTLMLLITGFYLVSMAGCDPVPEQTVHADKKGLSIVVSIQPLALLVTPFLSEGDQLHTLLEGAQSPHDFSLKASDRRLLDSADVLFWVGPELERPLSKLSKIVKAEVAMQISESSAEGEGNHSHHHHNHQEHHSDPHLWMSPELAINYQQRIAEWMIGRQPDRRESISRILEEQRSVIQSRVQMLSERLRSEVEPNQSYAAAHNAFGYFIEAFALPEPYILSSSPQLPPSAKSLVKAQTLLGTGQCILVESTNPAEWIDQFARSNQYRTLTIDVLADSGDYADYSEWLGELGRVFIDCLSVKAI